MVCECAGCSATRPALCTAGLQFLSVLLTEEAKRHLRDEDRAGSRPGPALAALLDKTLENQKALGRLSEVVIQVHDFLISLKLDFQPWPEGSAG